MIKKFRCNFERILFFLVSISSNCENKQFYEVVNHREKVTAKLELNLNFDIVPEQIDEAKSFNDHSKET